MEVNVSGLRMETGFAAGGEGGKSSKTAQKMAVAPQGSTEDGMVSSLNFSIDKIEMKLNALKIGMGGGEGMRTGTAGSRSSNIHETMMKSYFKHTGSKSGEESD